MDSALRIETAAPGELESLLAQQAHIQARIATLLPAQQLRSPIHKQQHRRRDDPSRIPRSLSVSGSTMTRHLSDRVEPPSQRSRTLSQRSAQSESMARTSSKGGIPFTGTMAPPLLSNTRQENPAIEAWQMQDQPLSSYTFSHQPHQRSNSHRGPNLEQVLELEDPAAWMARTGLVTPSVSLTPSPVVPPTNSPTHHLTISTQHDMMFNMQMPPTPSSDAQSLTTATTLTGNPMSRQNSLFCDNLHESIEMMNFNSQSSFPTDMNDQDHLYHQVEPHFTSSHLRRSSDEEQCQLLAGLGGTSHDSQFSQSFSSAETFALLQSTGIFGEKMEKSQSIESTSSTTSSASRSKQRLQATLAAARPIKPRGGDSAAMSRDNSSQSMTRLHSKEGSQDKVAISKPTYQRPKHDRVYCKQCDDHAEGFRGEHELRRHEDRQHKVTVKKWVCITPPSLHDLPKPVVPLSKCKACTQQRKQYGAYYNAAAHLRRAHFRPKAKGRSKSSSKADDPAKRAGKAGGNWPTMEELKPWMMEVEVMTSDYSLAMAQEDEAGLSDDDIAILDDQQSLGINIFQDSLSMYSSPTTDNFSMILDMHSQQSSLCDQNAFPFVPMGSSLPQSFENQFLDVPFSQYH